MTTIIPMRSANMNPDNNNHLREQLTGCHSKGVGTLNESEMVIHLADLSLDKKTYLPLVMRAGAP